jgi:hypothetical protein
MNKVCVTTYVYGEKYQDYIPLLIYSIHKAYPDYYIVLFLHGKLRKEIDTQLRTCDLYDNLEIKENVFADCPKMSPLKAASFRWVLWDDVFLNFDFLYIVDIDMFYIREPQELHIQHISHMKTTGLPFDNMRRKKINPQKLKLFIISFMIRIRHAGMKKIMDYILSYNKIEYCLSGLHFVDIKQYYSFFTAEKRNFYKELIYSGNYLEYIMNPNDELLLYRINSDLGFDLDKISVQTDETASLDFNNPERMEFRPHHGIHLGLFRRADNNFLRGYEKNILNSSTYKYYVNIFINEIKDDPKFIILYQTFNKKLRIYFERFYHYYSISR